MSEDFICHAKAGRFFLTTSCAMVLAALSASLATLGSSCSDASLYAPAGFEVAPDRLLLRGRLCTEDPSSEAFAVKVLFVLDNSLDMSQADPDVFRLCGSASCVPGSMQGIVEQFRSNPSVEFGFLAIGANATSFPRDTPQGFHRPQTAEVQTALTQLRSRLPEAALDIENAVAAIESFIFADISRSPPGSVLRTRYVVSMLTAGPPNPSVAASDALQAAALSERVEQLQSFVYNLGALDFRFNISQLYFGPRTIEALPAGFACQTEGIAAEPICICSASVRGNAAFCSAFCAIDSGQATEAKQESSRVIYRAMALAGSGSYTQDNCAQALSFRVDIQNPNIQLVRKDIVAFNRNARLTQAGPKADSDGDGLVDEDELNTTPPTDPTNADTDGDGLSDALEYRAQPRQNPLDPSDRPAICEAPADFIGIPDRDADLLNDCEEGLLQTAPTIPDTDGDGLVDFLEFLGGTLPTAAEDRLLDFDGDGLPNYEEVLRHTDPRNHDAALRGKEAYSNQIKSLGSGPVATVSPIDALDGIRFLDASSNTLGGVGSFRIQSEGTDENCRYTLEWADVRAGSLPPMQASPKTIDESGTIRLTAANAQAEIWLDVQVDFDAMPACSTFAEKTVFAPLVSVSERHCYDVRISNIKLVETLAANGNSAAGTNRVLVFFTQAPLARLSSPGLTRVAEIPVSFTCENANDLSTCTRTPADGIVELRDDDFVSLQP